MLIGLLYNIDLMTIVVFLPGLLSGFLHAREEKEQPGFPIAGEANGLEELVVLLAVLLEVEAEIEQRLAQGPFRAE